MKEVNTEPAKIPEKEEIEQTLVGVGAMYTKWGLKPSDWVVVDEIAYVLQGYEVIAKEMETCHLDTYVDISKLPWEPSRERSVIPPAKSSFFKDYCHFMEESGFGLDILATTPEDTILQQPMVNYELPNGKRIQLMEATAMTRQFWEKTLMHYSLEDVGAEKVEEWFAKLELIRRVAFNKGEKRLAKECQEMLVKAQERWTGALGVKAKLIRNSR